MIDRLSYWLIKKINKANRDFDLIAHGDRIAVRVSGGKDSLTLLELLHRRRRSVPTDYTLAPVHVVSDWRCTDQDQRAWLEQYFQSLGLEYAFREITIMRVRGAIAGSQTASGAPGTGGRHFFKAPTS